MSPLATMMISFGALLVAVTLANPKLLTGELQLGIDLGTTFSVVAVCQRGNVSVLPVDGHSTVPSVVSVSAEQPYVKVGRAAAARRLTHPSDTVYNVKRIIGRRLGDNGVKHDIDQLPYKVVSDLDAKGKETLSIELPAAHKRWSPSEISSVVLSKLKGTAEAAQGWRTKLGFRFSHVTVSVPVEFTWRQRDATKKAAELAGFRQVRLVEEPIAAAMAYGLEQKPGSRMVVVYDLGGGTLDVALLHLEDGTFRVVGTAGDPHLGGADFDRSVVLLLLERLSAFTPRNATQDSLAMQHLWTEAELAKCKLSAVDADTPVAVTLPYGFNTTITRREYDAINAPLFERALKPIKNVLVGNGFTKEEIHEIVLVGGSTRMPRIQAMVAEYFGKKELHNSIDPDEAIAVGAAAGFGCNNKK